MTTRQLAAFSLAASMALAGLTGCSSKSSPNHTAASAEPYPGKTMDWFAHHNDAAQTELQWCDQHFNQPQRNKDGYLSAGHPACWAATQVIM